jgi:hypothetical protein
MNPKRVHGSGQQRGIDVTDVVGDDDHWATLGNVLHPLNFPVRKPVEESLL